MKRCETTYCRGNMPCTACTLALSAAMEEAMRQAFPGKPAAQKVMMTILHERLKSVWANVIAAPNFVPATEPKFKRGDKVKINADTGSYAEVTSVRTDGPFKQKPCYYLRYHFGLDVRGQPITEVGGVQEHEIVAVTEKEFLNVANKRCRWGKDVMKEEETETRKKVGGKPHAR